MADKDLPINCKIKESNVDVGSGKKDTNKIVLEVTNTSAESISFSGRGARGEFSIAISIGKGPENLVDIGGGAAIKITAPSNWEAKKYVNREGLATYRHSLTSPVLSGGETVQLILAKFESHTDPGKAKITIGAKITGYNDYETSPPLEAEKKTEEFDLLYFTADPPYIITDEDRNKFKLTWNAVKAQRAVLYGNNARIEEFTEGSGGFQSGKPFTYANEMPSFTTVYKLVVTDKADGKNRKEQQVTVQKLNPGWYSVDFPYGYPAVLCSMDGVKLYGIFINKGKAGLYSSEYPYAAWTLVSSKVPDGMETSPAVYFRNRLWLVGGSTADPNARSNMVSCYKKDTGKWSPPQQSPWSARMGHACVVDNISNPNRLFVLGGNDETGTSVNEVWAAELMNDGDQLEWKEIPQREPGTDSPKNPWKPRCMFAATFFNKKIWIYGGATAPFSDPLEDMWVSENGESWVSYETIPKDNKEPVGKPIGSTLQVIKNKLNLIGSFRRGTIVTPRKFILEEAQQSWQGSSVEQPWDGQENNTFSLLSVQHKGLIILRSLNYRTHDNPTKLYVYVP